MILPSSSDHKLPPLAPAGREGPGPKGQISPDTPPTTKSTPRPHRGRGTGAEGPNLPQTHHQPLSTKSSPRPRRGRGAGAEGPNLPPTHHQPLTASRQQPSAEPPIAVFPAASDASPQEVPASAPEQPQQRQASEPASEVPSEQAEACQFAIPNFQPSHAQSTHRSLTPSPDKIRSCDSPQDCQPPS
jgi:hypothetical protein